MKHNSDLDSSSSAILVTAIEEILNILKYQCHRSSTRENYYRIWKHFNKFFVRLDAKPDHWEDRLLLFVGHLIQHKRKSNTIRSYVSAIRAILIEVGYELKEDVALLSALTKATRLHQDTYTSYLPIRKNLMELLLSSVEKYFGDNPQPYLTRLYRALISTTYYGLFRIGEVTQGPHVIKAKNVYRGKNKNKLLFVLFTSKTHCADSRPQTVKISQIRDRNKSGQFCPFTIVNEYLEMRVKNKTDQEQFFVFSDRSPVKPEHFRIMLRNLLKFNNIDWTRYRVHDFRSGHATEMLENGVPIDKIRKLGRWKTSTVFKYLKN